jgi:hypothetical protein
VWINTVPVFMQALTTAAGRDFLIEMTLSLVASVYAPKEVSCTVSLEPAT